MFISGNMPMQTEITPLLIMTQLEQFDYAGATALALVMLVALVRAAARDQRPARRVRSRRATGAAAAMAPTPPPPPHVPSRTTARAGLGAPAR